MKFRFLSATKEGKLQFFERVIQFFLSHSYLLLGNCPAPWSTRARVAITRININTFRHFSRLVFSSFSLPRECACRHSPPSFVYKWHRLSASSANFSNRRVKGYTRCSRRWIRQITGKEPHRPLPFPFSFFCVLSSPPPLLLSPSPHPALFFWITFFPPFCRTLPLFTPIFRNKVGKKIEAEYRQSVFVRASLLESVLGEVRTLSADTLSRRKNRVWSIGRSLCDCNVVRELVKIICKRIGSLNRY